MWLKDFLPYDVQGIRIMSYGYNSSQYGGNIDIDILDHRRNLLQTLANALRSTPVCILLDPPAVYSLIACCANSSYLKSKESAIDIYWAWGGRHLDTSGKAI
jgi:hypothetical protein